MTSVAVTFLADGSCSRIALVSTKKPPALLRIKTLFMRSTHYTQWMACLLASIATQLSIE